MSSSRQSRKNNGPVLRAAGALALIVVSLVYGWATLSKYTRGLPPRPRRALVMPAPAGPAAAAKPTPGLRSVMPTAEERLKIMNSMFGRVSVTADQRKKLEEIWITGPQGVEGLAKRIEDSRKILSTQQAAALTPMFVGVVAVRVERARGLMRPQDFSALSRRLQGMAQDKSLNPLAR